MYLKNFLEGYAKSIEIIPNFNDNNLFTDFKNIGKDIYISIEKKRKEIKKIERQKRDWKVYWTKSWNN